MVQLMTRHRFSGCRTSTVPCGLLVLLFFVVAASCAGGEPQPAAVSTFNSYVNVVESRLSQRHGSQSGFLAPVGSGAQGEVRLRRGELIIEQLTPSTGEVFSGAMLHDWRGTAFAAGATAADFERLMKDFNAYPQRFSPQVLQARVLVQKDGSTRISEIDSPGTGAERALNSSEEHGFLWRLNTYWSYEERDGGLYLQAESVSLTRSIPRGLAWAVGPFVESVPRESLEFTLRSTCNALRK